MICRARRWSCVFTEINPKAVGFLTTNDAVIALEARANWLTTLAEDKPYYDGWIALLLDAQGRGRSGIRRRGPQQGTCSGVIAASSSVPPGEPWLRDDGQRNSGDCAQICIKTRTFALRTPAEALAVVRKARGIEVDSVHPMEPRRVSKVLGVRERRRRSVWSRMLAITDTERYEGMESAAPRRIHAAQFGGGGDYAGGSGRWLFQLTDHDGDTHSGSRGRADDRRLVVATALMCSTVRGDVITCRACGSERRLVQWRRKRAERPGSSAVGPVCGALRTIVPVVDEAGNLLMPNR